MSWSTTKNGYDVYFCNGCKTNGRSIEGTGLPDGWTHGLLGGDYCPRCTAKREAKEAESKAKDRAAREAQAAHDATPEGKKERNIAALSILAAVLLFLLFACVFHLYGVAFIVGFVAASPYFWFRARKAGFVILAIILVVLAAKIWF